MKTCLEVFKLCSMQKEKIITRNLKFNVAKSKIESNRGFFFFEMYVTEKISANIKLSRNNIFILPITKCISDVGL